MDEDLDLHVRWGPKASPDEGRNDSSAIQEPLTVKNNGQVGIGTTSPQSKLSVSGGVGIGSSYAGSHAAPTDGLTVEGNVGIGTTSPSAKLEVQGGQTVLEQEAWHTPTFQNGWVNFGDSYNPAGYFKDSLGIVHLRGLVKDGSGTIFTLPAGYRPPNRELQAVQTDRNTIGRIDILADGTLLMYAGSNGWISLDGITFRAA
jgi:hypothetical protein